MEKLKITNDYVFKRIFGRKGNESILKDFLIENRAEVIAMSIFEFDEEREMKLIREEEYQSGLEDGIKKGEYITLYNRSKNLYMYM